MGNVGEEGLSDVITPPKVVSILLQDTNSVGREWRVIPEFTVRQLAELVSYRVEEVFFTEEKGLLHVNDRNSSGETAGRRHYDAYKHLENREANGLLVAHIHPMQPGVSGLANRGPTYFLSWFDIWNAAYSSHQPNVRLVLFHSKGGVEYAAPNIPGDQVRDSLAIFSEEVGIDCMSVHMLKQFSMHIHQASPERKIELGRMFAERYGMIKQEYEWRDKAGMQKLVDIINLQ